MKYPLFLFFLPVLSVIQCNKSKIETPSCVQQKIDQVKVLPKFNPPAEVNEYIYQGKQVYLFSADCCDQYNSLFDNNCTYLCAPSGGITGQGDMKCTDFSSSARFVKLVWKDPR